MPVCWLGYVELFAPQIWVRKLRFIGIEIVTLLVALLSWFGTLSAFRICQFMSIHICCPGYFGRLIFFLGVGIWILEIKIVKNDPFESISSVCLQLTYISAKVQVMTLRWPVPVTGTQKKVFCTFDQTVISLCIFYALKPNQFGPYTFKIHNDI